MAKASKNTGPYTSHNAPQWHLLLDPLYFINAHVFQPSVGDDPDDIIKVIIKTTEDIQYTTVFIG